MVLRYFLICIVFVLLIFPATSRAQSSSLNLEQQQPVERSYEFPPDDYSMPTLDRYLRAVMVPVRGDYRIVPLDAKAKIFEWLIWRYHMTPYHQVHTRVILPNQPGIRPTYGYGADLSTWNGALLAAMCYKYAVTRDQQTLDRITEILQGLHFYIAITGRKGLLARCVLETDKPYHKCVHRHIDDEGHGFYSRASPAKGTYNQVMVGYATLMMLVGDNLPPHVFAMARADMHSLVTHLIRNDYEIRDVGGEKSEFGNLTPFAAQTGVPFNSQVSYMIVATGYHFPPNDKKQRRQIFDAFDDLRDDNHVYYERPLRSLLYPQHVGASPFLKGMNDRNHVTNAAFVGLAMDIRARRTAGRKLDEEFLYQLGRTMHWSMKALDGKRNSLCSFMWAGLLKDRGVFKDIVPHNRDQTRAQLSRLIPNGIEQLRRFRIDRRVYPGEKRVTIKTQWNDADQPSSYYWKEDPNEVWIRTGPASSKLVSAIDYLHAYWLMRYYKLDQGEDAQRVHGVVLRQSTQNSQPVEAVRR